MIRLIQRRLIIPQGDTGTFSIPLIGTVETTDVAVFSILDPLTKENLLNLFAEIDNEILIITFSHEDTKNLKPGKYLWDIKVYKEPEYDEINQDNIFPIDGQEINSYYAAYSLPICEVKEAPYV